MWSNYFDKQININICILIWDLLDPIISTFYIYLILFNNLLIKLNLWLLSLSKQLLYVLYAQVIIIHKSVCVIINIYSTFVVIWFAYVAQLLNYSFYVYCFIYLLSKFAKVK